ncbi:galactoside 2-alpha-L-fucosyltransferase 3 [Biomphalaria pfeifferi]|uniref:L-Fucosyltransferase n=1 Tax=Biomphalaria pfeifferi TaxID=112525 RepID=A0AAD8AUK9_BIOPF|nr:galactoside 2-alpha-L-fucosyltransferase 3 [Biomphalaria pfeifferi]
MGVKCKGCGSCFLFLVTTFVVYKLSLPKFLENFDPEGDVPSDSRMLPKAERTYNGQHIICHKFEGSLGSQLFQYASLLGIAAPQKRIIVARGNTSLGHVLKSPKQKRGKSQCKNVERLVESTCCRLDERLINLENSKNYEIEGKLRSWKYFKDSLDLIRQSVHFHDGITKHAKKRLEKTLQMYNATVTDKPIVGIYVKRGDILNWSSVDEGYRVAPREYFLKAMKFFRDHLRTVVSFLVLSDDIEWCKSNFLGLPGVMLTSGHQEEAVNLATLSLLDHTIISVGSFSWWAAFLTKGKVIFYSEFVEKNSKIRNQFDASFEDYIMPGWIPM